MRILVIINYFYRIYFKKGINDSNNNFEIYEKKQTRDSLMDKINNELNNINKHNNENDNNNNNIIKLEECQNNQCDVNCRCENCQNKYPENNNNFANFQTVSFKNPDQVDIVVEHDKKQACCVIYNNNCIIF